MSGSMNTVSGYHGYSRCALYGQTISAPALVSQMLFYAVGRSFLLCAPGFSKVAMRAIMCHTLTQFSIINPSSSRLNFSVFLYIRRKIHGILRRHAVEWCNYSFVPLVTCFRAILHLDSFPNMLVRMNINNIIINFNSSCLGVMFITFREVGPYSFILSSKVSLFVDSS